MIMLNPNTLRGMSPLLDLMSQRGIVPGGYSSLKPLWVPDGNPAIVNEAEGLARRKGVSAEQVLLRWCRAKGWVMMHRLGLLFWCAVHSAVVFTSSTSRDRVRQYLLAGDVELTAEEVATLGKAGMP
jgi:diketogulonate reductase-like aldo/keto reductase